MNQFREAYRRTYIYKGFQKSVQIWKPKDFNLKIFTLNFYFYFLFLCIYTIIIRRDLQDRSQEEASDFQDLPRTIGRKIGQGCEVTKSLTLQTALNHLSETNSALTTKAITKVSNRCTTVFNTEVVTDVQIRPRLQKPLNLQGGDEDRKQQRSRARKGTCSAQRSESNRHDEEINEFTIRRLDL